MTLFKVTAFGAEARAKDGILLLTKRGSNLLQVLPRFFINLVYVGDFVNPWKRCIIVSGTMNAYDYLKQIERAIDYESMPPVPDVAAIEWRVWYSAFIEEKWRCCVYLDFFGGLFYSIIIAFESPLWEFENPPPRSDRIYFSYALSLEGDSHSIEEIPDEVAWGSLAALPYVPSKLPSWLLPLGIGAGVVVGVVALAALAGKRG